MTSTKDLQELEGWIAHEACVDERLSALALEHNGGRVRWDEIHRLEPGELGWATAEAVARIFDDVAVKHALSSDGVEQYQLMAFRDGQLARIYPFIKTGKIPMPVTEGELCARIVEGFETGKSPIETVLEYRLTLTAVLKIHGQWRAAQRAHTPKLAATRARRAPTKIPDARGPSAA